MNTPAQRLKAARIAAGFKTASAAAARYGWNKNTYASNENRNAGFSYRRAVEYGRAFGVSGTWIYLGDDSQPKPSEPVIYDCMAGRFEFDGAP